MRLRRMHTLSKLKALSCREWRVLLGAAMLLPIASLAVRFARLEVLARHLAVGPARRRAEDRMPPARVAALVRAAAARHPLPSTCLARSLLLAWLLRRQGWDAALRIGVRLPDGRLEAHAWVEQDGEPLAELPDVGVRFAAFAGEPGPRGARR